MQVLCRATMVAIVDRWMLMGGTLTLALLERCSLLVRPASVGKERRRSSSGAHARCWVLRDRTSRLVATRSDPRTSTNQRNAVGVVGPTVC
jgi:hypothetical protein